MGWGGLPPFCPPGVRLHSENPPVLTFAEFSGWADFLSGSMLGTVGATLSPPRTAP